jgi:phosphatidylethanolamine-binding protein (PEBP) family uncharacterized protein
MPLLLASPAIPAGGEIPVQYICDGGDIWPPRTVRAGCAETAEPYAIQRAELVGTYQR